MLEIPPGFKRPWSRTTELHIDAIGGNTLATNTESVEGDRVSFTIMSDDGISLVIVVDNPQILYDLGTDASHAADQLVNDLRAVGKDTTTFDGPWATNC